ncbi:MAG: hypothetical protein M3O30_17075 [Planctomycetota bacterium]|nr:hypothetical protein [Planctomycetota bacterium]
MVTPNLGWSRRWVELRPHPEQSRLWIDRTRFKLVPAGRRSGKSELAKRRLVEHLGRRTTHGQPGRYFAAAPTRDQAKRIFWADLKALLPQKLRCRISETDLCITTPNGAQLWVHGLDVPQRIEGTPWDGCVIDELANCRAGIWDAHIRPALADRRGWAWLIGVPDMDAPGQVEYEHMVHVAQSAEDDEWRCFTWPSADILPEEEIESARRRLDPRIFEQEFQGKFVIARGKAFSDFDPTLHIKPAAYDPALPICWSLDFNIDPMCSGIIQHHKGHISVIDELTLPDTDTDAACDVFLDRAKQRAWNLYALNIYGDATGAARDSTSGISDWYILEKRLRGLKPRFQVPKCNPPIKDTINAIRAKLKTADGATQLTVDPRCHTLIDDLRTALWPGNLEPHHALAWLRYFTQAQYPVLPEITHHQGVVSFST